MWFLLLACTRAIEETPKDLEVTDTQDSADPVSDDDRVRAMDPSQLPAGPSPCRDPLLARVSLISDGDTAHMDVYDGAWKSETVRFLGIDTPELAHNGDPAECYATEASVHLDELIQGKLVWLTFDAECSDTYDRTLAYVHRDSTNDGFINRHQVRQGYGYAFPWDPPVAMAGAIAEDEAAAKAEDLGLWSACR